MCGECSKCKNYDPKLKKVHIHFDEVDVFFETSQCGMTKEQLKSVMYRAIEKAFAPYGDVEVTTGGEDARIGV